MIGSTNAAKAAAINTFEQFDLAPFLQKTIEKIGFTEPTPIQADAIPRILDGKDVMGLAQTGTGKTVAFVLPLVQRVCSEKKKAVQAVILTPTRELADQVNDVVRQFTPRTGVKSTTIYGGVSHRSQITALRSNPQIIVACPGRLLDHISAKTIDLSQVDHLVLDEADRMLDMGFMPDIKKIIATLSKERQTLLFSATMPDEIAELSDNVLRKPEVIKVKTNQPVALVNHSMFSVKRDAKLERFINLMKVNNDSVTVVFTKMKYTAKRLGEQLTKAGVAGVALHGNLSQAQRKRALQGFRDGKYRVLIATDIASRGIDVQGITHVVNYDMPDTLEAYIHRTGRVGRASNTGEAISFVMRSDKDILRSVEKWLGHRLSQLNTDEPKEDDMNREDSESKTRDDTVALKSSKESRVRTKRTGHSDRREMRNKPKRPYGDKRRSNSRDPRPDTRRKSKTAPKSKAGSRAEFSERGGDRTRTQRSQRWNRTEQGQGSPWRNARPDRYGGRARPASENRNQPGRKGGKSSRTFRGQQDIDPRARYVYRESEPVFIERFEEENRPAKNPRSRSPRGAGSRPRGQGGPRNQNGARGQGGARGQSGRAPGRRPSGRNSTGRNGGKPARPNNRSRVSQGARD